MGVPFFPGKGSMIDKSIDQSVVEHPDLMTGFFDFGGFSQRGPLLPQWGTRERERSLRLLWHHDYNTIFKGAVAGIIKRIQSTPWQIRAPAGDGDRWQKTTMLADFGSWERFVSKVLLDYHRHDQGAIIELIGPGDPNQVIYGPITGMAVLDSMRCWPTGNPTYPFVYYDIKQKMHVMHRSRVVQFVDTPDSEEARPGVGECALSRCVAPVMQEILMGRYVEQFLDDKPPPGLMVFGNISKDQSEQAMAALDTERQADDPMPWGRNIRLYGLEAENKPTVDFISYTKAPEGFDYEKFTLINVNKIALGTGLDIQDLWEMTQGGLNPGRTSEILAQKSRGKAIGRIIKGLERALNQAYPEDVEFEFVYEDPQEDAEQAQLADTTARTVTSLSSVLSTDEQRTMLSNLIPAVHDVVTDAEGKVTRLSDDDPKGPLQAVQEDVVATLAPATPQPQVTAPASQAQLPATTGLKEFDPGDFASRFAKFAAGVTEADRAGALRAAFREELYDAGFRALQAGMADAGVPFESLDATQKADARRAVGGWLAAQAQYIDNFVGELIATGGMSRGEATERATAWINKSIREVYTIGLAANPGALFRWEIDPQKDHCRTCVAMNGQVHRMADYEASGIVPGSHSLECGGWECGCKLVRAAPSERERGTIPGYTVVNRLQSWLGGLLGG